MLRYAREHGVTTLTTETDSRNGPMLALNRKLGYVMHPGYYGLVKSLADDR